ncbi:MAG: PspC domain-containing protein [Patescibacteria group bacterium]
MSSKLYRSRENRMIAGVCGGLGEYFQIDPVLIRVLFVMAALWGGIGFLCYLVMWIVILEEPLPLEERMKRSSFESKPATSVSARGHEGGRVGIILIVLGIIFFINNFAPHWNIWQYWPLILVGFGIWLFTKTHDS